MPPISELRLSPGASRSAPDLRQMLLRRNGFRAAELVVEEDARGDVRPLPPPIGQREQERQRLDQMRRQRRQRQLALVQRLAHQAELQLLEVAQAAVEHLRRLRLEVPEAKSRASTSATFSPRVAASRAAPAPTTPPPMTTTSNCSLPSRSQACARCSGPEEGLPVARSGDRVTHVDGLLVTRRYGCPSQVTWAQSRSSCAISRRAASMIEPDSDGYTEKRLRQVGRPTMAVLHRQRDRQDQLGGDRRDHHTADHHAGGRAAEDLDEAAAQAATSWPGRWCSAAA